MMMPPPPPAGKKTSPWVWVLIVVVGLMFVVGALVAVGSYLFVRKVKQVADGNPASVVRMIASMNPDVEVLNSDDSAGTVTIKDKKTGKVVTLNFEDVKNGKISFQEDGKEAVVIQGGKDGEASIDVRSAEGTAHFGAGSAKAPAWVPAYPGSSPTGHFTQQTEKENTGSYSFKTPDALDKVSKHYQDALKGAGFKLSNIVSSGDGAMVNAETADGKRTLIVTMSADGGETNVAIMFKEAK